MTPEKTLPEIVEGIKDCILQGFAAQMSTLQTKDGWTLGQYCEVLAHHLSPVIARFLMSVSFIEVDRSMKELKASHEQSLAELNDKISLLQRQIAALQGQPVPPRNWPWARNNK